MGRQQVKNMNKPLCIYHGNCADGFTSAWAVWRRFEDDFEYHAGVYQNPPPDVTNRVVVLVDFSYKRDVLLKMAERSQGVLILDHHKSAIEDLKADENYVIDFAAYGGEKTWNRFIDNISQDRMEGTPYGRVYSVFDLERSGAGIAWDFFHPDRKRSQLVNYAEDRDLWRFKLPLSREVNAFIFSYDYAFENWDYLHAMLADDFTLQAAADAGGAIERKHHKDVAELVRTTKMRMTIGGHEVWAANLPYTLTSDAGNLMAQDAPFAACYWDTPEGRVFSLRSTGAGIDVSEIAKMYGGGGHKNASGFRLPHGKAP